MKMRKTSRKAGFTLVELMVVAIIVAILAAVSIPLMSGNKRRAAATEAEAGLGTIRSCLRAMFAETEAYNVKPGGSALGTGTITSNSVPGIRAGDLAGTYWQEGNYSVTAVDATTLHKVTADEDIFGNRQLRQELQLLVNHADADIHRCAGRGRGKICPEPCHFTS